MISTLVKKEIKCPKCQDKFIWQSDNWNVTMALIYNAWLDSTVNHVWRCRNGNA